MAILREISVNYTFTEIDCDLTGKQMTSPELVYKAFNFLKYETKERFIVINLNSQHGIMNYETVAIGSVRGVSLRIAEVLRSAIIIGAPEILLAHNHPSGVPEPSQADIHITKKINDVAKQLSIDVLDHIIIGENGFVSLKQNGDI